jgi:hypothetical protein
LEENVLNKQYKRKSEENRRKWKGAERKKRG